jgi:hypothetical protein
MTTRSATRKAFARRRLGDGAFDELKGRLKPARPVTCRTSSRFSVRRANLKPSGTKRGAPMMCLPFADSSQTMPEAREVPIGDIALRSNHLRRRVFRRAANKSFDSASDDAVAIEGTLIHRLTEDAGRTSHALPHCCDRTGQDMQRSDRRATERSSLVRGLDQRHEEQCLLALPHHYRQ